MDPLLLVLLVAVPVLSVLGWVFWIAVGWFAIRKTMAVAQHQQSDLDQFLVQVERALLAASSQQAGPGLPQQPAAQGRIPGASPTRLTPEQQLQLQAMLMQVQNQMRQVDNLSRQRYESRVSDLHGLAASAGIDWTPSY